MSLFKDPPSPLITYYFLECFGEVVTKNPDADVHTTMQVAAKLAFGSTFSDKALPLAVERLAQLSAEEPKPAADPSAPTPSLLFRDFSEWLDGLTNDKRCLVAMEGDFEKAKQLYRDLDISVAKQIIALKTEQLVKTQRAHFEAVLYGQGGHLEKDVLTQGGEPEVVLDLTDNSQQNLAMTELKQLGF